MKYVLLIIFLECKTQLALSHDKSIENDDEDVFDEDDKYIFDFLWIPEKYYINIMEIYKEWKIFYAEVRMEGMTTKETNHLYLHSNVKIVSGLLNVDGVSTEIKLNTAVHDMTNDMLMINLNKTLALHQYFTLKFVYYGNVTTKYNDPFHRINEIDGNNLSRPIWSTEFQPFGARSVFPCIDLPRLKANIQIKISSNKQNKILSNMPFKTFTHGKNREHVFYQSPKMSTYIIAFVMFGQDLKCEKLLEENQYCYFFKGNDNFKDQLSVFPIIRNIIANFTNIPYMLPKLDHVVIGKKETVAMESWGLITWRNNLFSSNELMTINDKMYLYEIIAHEIAHQWFGNLVTCKFWCYIWLNEGVVTYVQNLIVDMLFPESKILELFVVDKMWDTMLYEIYGPWALVHKHYCSEEKKTHISISYRFYKKGASILHMVAQTVMPPGTFQKALQSYLRTYQYSTVVEKDFWLKLEMHIDKSILLGLYANNSLADYMETWTNNKGHPLVIVLRELSKVYVRQERFNKRIEARRNCGGPEYWWIPITYTVSFKPNFNDTSIKQWIKPDCIYEALTDINIGPNDWIILNIQHAGYYRVMYDSRTYELLVHYLIKNDIDVIHPLNRAQIINDAFELANLKYHNIDVPLNLTKYMSKETHFFPFHAAMNHLKRLLKEYRGIPSTHSIHNYIKKIISVAYERVTSKNFSINDIVNYKYKMEVIDMACQLEFLKCDQQALLLAHDIVQGKQSEKLIIPELRTTLWCSAVRNNNETIPNYLMNKLKSPSTSPMLTKVYSDALACSRNQDVLYRFVDWVFNNENNEGFTALTLSFAPKDFHCVIINYISDNINKLISRFGRNTIQNQLLQLSITTKLPLCVILMQELAKNNTFILFPNFGKDNDDSVNKWFKSQDPKYFLSELPTSSTDGGSLDNISFLKQNETDFFKIPTKFSSK